MPTVVLNLRDKNIRHKTFTRTVDFMREFWKQNPHQEIKDWIKYRGNDQHSTQSFKADLELVSFFVAER